MGANCEEVGAGLLVVSGEPPHEVSKMMATERPVRIKWLNFIMPRFAEFPRGVEDSVCSLGETDSSD